MINGKLYNTAEAEYPNVDVLSCRPGQIPRIISGNTLGGQWFVQSIGLAATKAAVSLRVIGETARRNIIAIWATGVSFTVTFDGQVFTGFILEEPAYEMLMRGDPAARQYSMTFNFAITSEEALT